MKNKTCFFTGFILLLLVVSLDAQQYVTLEDKQFRLNGQDFYPIMTNYSVETIWDQLTNQTFVAPNHCYDTSFFQEGNSQDSCLSLIQRDFDYIAGMGFNGVRCYSFYPKFNKSDSSFVFYRNSYDTSKHDSIFLDPTNPHDTSMQIVFKLYDQLLEIANNTVNNITNQPSPLKLIFIITGSRSNYSDYEIGIWNDYLNSLSRHLDTTANNNAMLAYDLINEPCYTVLPTKNKTDACDMVSAWYNTIKANDKKHLVTIGSCGYDDVFSFDPSILKVDFYSLHCYPYWRNDYEDRHDDSIQQRAWSRLLNQFYWMEHNCTRPWMIGETGFSASVNYTIDSGNMDGTLTDQANFAAYTLNASRNCGASGYSWGGYQDIHNNSFGAPGFSSDFIGIIERYSVPGSWSEKPAVDTFRYWNYVKDTCPVCYSSSYDTAKLYYNPYRHPTFDSVTEGFIKYGYVVDQNDDPIKDAYFWTDSWISGKGDRDDENDVTNSSYTFSDINGYYEIIPFDYVDILNDSAYVYRIETSAACSEVLFTNMWQTSWPANNSTITFEQVDYSYYGNVKSLTLSSGEDSVFSGHYHLKIEDVTVQNNASATFYATNKVHIKPGFTASAGSSTSIYCADTAIICSDYDWDSEWKKALAIGTNNSNEANIEIQFRLDEQAEVIRVHPNPTRGIVNIELNNFITEATYQVCLFDVFGTIMFQIELNTKNSQHDLTSYPKGIYFLKISDSKTSYIKKILKQ